MKWRAHTRSRALGLASPRLSTRRWSGVLIALVVVPACDLVSGHSELKVTSLGPIEASSRSGWDVPALLVLPSLDSRPPVLAIAMANASLPGSSIRFVELGPSDKRTRDVQYPEWTDVGPGICAAPDVDGDGKHDLVLRVLRAGADEAHPIAGIALVSSSSGTVSYEVSEPSTYQFGHDLALIDDRDGDGIEDIVVGEPESLHFGAKPGPRRVFSLYEESVRHMPLHADGCSINWDAPSSGRVHVLSGATGAPIRTIDAPQAAFGFGSAVERIADIDGDGATDLAVGAGFACDERCAEGRVLIYSSGTYEQLGALGRDLDLPEFAGFGMSIAAAPDRSGASRYDLVVGAPQSERAYLLRLGRPERASIPLHLVVTEREEFEWRNEALGASVAACCDVDGDSIGDWAVLAPASYNVPAHRGSVHFLSGFDGGFLASTEGGDGMRIVGMACGVGAPGAQQVGALIRASRRYESFDVAVALRRPNRP